MKELSNIYVRTVNSAHPISGYVLFGAQEVRVIDFGGAVLKKEKHGRHIGTRQYRSPEVVLGLAWDEKTDVP